MSKREVITICFGTLMCVGLVLVLISLASVQFGVAMSSAAPWVLIGFTMCIIGGLITFFCDPLISGG